MGNRRKFEAWGTDDQGDVHSFASDDPERALAMFAEFTEDLMDVTLSEPLSRYQAMRP
jgi:hypothetical protein